MKPLNIFWPKRKKSHCIYTTAKNRARINPKNKTSTLFVKFSLKKTRETTEDPLQKKPKRKSNLQQNNHDNSSKDSDNSPDSRFDSDYLLQQPKLLTGGQLMTHQMEALNWLIGLYNIDQNGILADQMGLGKTIEVISLFAYLYEYKGNQGPHLVVCPLSVVNNWKRELDKWLPDLRSRCLYATEKEREKCWKDVIDPRDFDIIITSFEGMKKSLNKLKKFTWDYFVIDEAHKLKNAESQFFEKSTEIKTLRT